LMNSAERGAMGMATLPVSASRLDKRRDLRRGKEAPGAGSRRAAA
jgi:hypothetical protein